MAEEFHEHTWQVLAGDHVVVHTRRGSRPGSAWADSFFGLLLERVLLRRSRDLVDATTPAVPWDGKLQLCPILDEQSAVEWVPASEIIFADDLAILTSARYATRIGAAVTEVTATVVDSFEAHGLRANFARTKTAALVAPVGPGARQARRDLFFRSKGRLPVLKENSAPSWLELVPSYKHLGTVVDYKASVHADVSRRISLARVAFREGRRAIYVNPHIPVSRRAVLFRANVLGVLLHGAGAWAWMLEGTFRAFSGAVMGMYRQMIRIKRDAAQNWSRRQICVAVQLPSPQCILHVERLRFLCLLVRSGPRVLWAALRYDQEYVQALRAAMRWMCERVQATSSLRDPDVSWDEWIRAIQDSPKKFRGWIKRASELDGCWATCRVAVELAIREVWSSSVKRVSASGAEHEHACIPCKVAFASRQAWSAHAARCHGYRARYTVAATGRSCKGCGKTFATVRRLSRHLSHSSACLAVAESLPAGQQDCDDGHVQAPPVQVFASVECLPPRLPELVELHQALASDNPQTTEQVWAIVRSVIGALPDIRSILESWAHGLECRSQQEAALDVAGKLFPHELGAAFKGAAPGESADVCDELLQPCLTPFPEAPLPVGVTGCVGVPVPDRLRSIGAESCSIEGLTFESPPELQQLCRFAALVIQIPAAPVGHAGAWQPVATTLKASWRYAKWAAAALEWLSLGLRVAYSCKRVHFSFAAFCPGAALFRDWVLGCGGSQDCEGGLLTVSPQEFTCSSRVRLNSETH